jgi:[acyl-carrier-protein] S-malonyltransferase
MGKIAFVFSGQGAQHTGMGLDLYNNLPHCSEIFDSCDKSRPGTSAQCFLGSEEELSQTVNTQPCMFALELAAAAALSDAGVKADITAGFSLGEIAALQYSGVVSFEDAFRMVCRRGELMQTDSESADSGMAAVLKLDAAAVEALCSRYEHVYPVNYNCPGQISVSGLRPELDDFLAAVKEAGGRAVPLKVRGGFHSPFMQNAAECFKEALRDISFHPSEVTLYSNYTGLPYSGDCAMLLSKQICSPVRWQNLIGHMIDSGADTFIEIGPGKTLCGLIGKINSSVKVLNVEDCESLNKTVKEVSGC